MNKRSIIIHYGCGIRTVVRGGRLTDLNQLDRHEERALRAAIVSRYPHRRRNKRSSK